MPFAMHRGDGRSTHATSASAVPSDPMDLRITSSTNDHGTTIRVEGRLTFGGVGELERLFSFAERPVQLDLSGLISADDQGVRAIGLLSVGGVTVSGASPYIRQLLDDAS